MISFKGINHFSIVVDNIEKASLYYKNLLRAKPVLGHDHFKNEGFALSAGFIENPEKIEVSIRFLKISGVKAMIELIEFHNPKGKQRPDYYDANDVSGVRHIGIEVEDIEEAFSWVADHDEVRLISDFKDYRPHTMSELGSEDVRIFGEHAGNTEIKKAQAREISKIIFFYFLDKYGVQWEFWGEKK